MKRKISSIALFILLGAVGASIVMRASDRFFASPAKNETQQGGEVVLKEGQSKASLFPIPLEHPQVTAAFIHYFLKGTVKEVQNKPEGPELFLVAQDKNLPRLLLGGNVRVSRISPPYSSRTRTEVGVGALKAGQYVEISIEYELRSKRWIIRDVLIPTDKNP